MILSRVLDLVRGETLKARALRGAMWTFLGFGGGQALRLLSNLVLTRLLFPEAFGLVALIQVVVTGLEMFSDAGINTSILQSRNGEKPEFLNTAWSLQIGRGLLLWVMTLVLAVPVANFYGQPDLALMLPVAGLSVLILGFQSTNMATANRNLVLGRMTFIELASQLVGIIVMIALAYWWQSVWALVLGFPVAPAVRVVLSHMLLPGLRNRLHWDRGAFWELFHFGKYIFIGSAAGFLINNGDRAILGRFIDVGTLGIYNIGFFLATVPIMLTRQLTSRVLLPVYVKTPPAESPQNRHKVRLARLGITGAMLGLAVLLTLIGVPLVQFLYTPDYALAGPILVLLSLSYMPVLVSNAYTALFLGGGNSRDFTIQLIVLAGVQCLILFLGVRNFGLIGAIVAPGLSIVLIYPLTAFFAHRQGGWDPLFDAGFGAVIALMVMGFLLLAPGNLAVVLGAG